MIFILHYFLIMAGYSACGLLLGAYMIRYAEATELELGFVFMIQPLSMFFRPLVCARADRHQTHKQMLAWCCLGKSLAYVPFVVIPVMLAAAPHLRDTYLTAQVCFWVCSVSHLVGSMFFCGVRSLGDALACNYAKRINSDFTCYRKYGAISFGSMGFFLGHFNQGSALPDYVASHVTLVGSMALLAALIYLWPDEAFRMISDHTGSGAAGEKLGELPNARQTIQHMTTKLGSLLCCAGRCCAKSAQYEPKQPCTPQSRTNMSIASSNNNAIQDKLSRPHVKLSRDLVPIDLSAQDDVGQQKQPLTVQQQVRIFMLLMQRDFRIPLFFLFLVYGGMTGYAPQNYVFTYIDQVCHSKGICDGAKLSGLVMICFCAAETTCYLILNWLRVRINMNFVVLLEATLLSLAIHYYFYGFVLDHVSPYFFLVEMMHGLEYSASLSTSVELGYRFANEVEILIPELLERKIIGPEHDRELVRLSLMATMSACFTLAYDGAGTITGAFIYGIVTDRYGFQTTWILIGTLASVGFFAIMIIVLIGKCFRIRPQILQIRDNPRQTTV